MQLARYQISKTEERLQELKNGLALAEKIPLIQKSGESDASTSVP
jgi:hypothetical protein